MGLNAFDERKIGVFGGGSVWNENVVEYIVLGQGF